MFKLIKRKKNKFLSFFTFENTEHSEKIEQGILAFKESYHIDLK